MKLILFSLTFFCLTPSFASEQIDFKISFDRSINISSPKKLQSLSNIGDSVTINSKGRLWLTGNESNQNYYEILCQSRSSSPVSIELQSINSPWIKVSGSSGCSDWSNNLLVCSDNEIEKAMFCKIQHKSILNSTANNAKRRTTSVAVRSVNTTQITPDSSDYNDIVDQTMTEYSTGINLCNDIYPKDSNVIISWTVFDGGTTGDIDIDQKNASQKNLNFANCVVENIEFWNFPNWKKNFKIKYSF